jgi:hypothetical protein
MGRKRARAKAEAFEAGTEPTAVEAAFEPEPYEGLSIVAVDDLQAIELSAIETPLADADEAALEAGIASVFDTILAEGFDAPANDLGPHDDAASEDDAESEDDSDATFALLAELNRIWAQPLAA